MPTHLHKERPPIESDIGHLCTCSDCSRESTYDHRRGLPVQGRFLSANDLKDHRKNERQKAIASSRLAAVAQDVDPSPFATHEGSVVAPSSTTCLSANITPSRPPPPLAHYQRPIFDQNVPVGPASVSGCHSTSPSFQSTSNSPIQLLEDKLHALQQAFKLKQAKDLEMQLAVKPLVFAIPPSSSRSAALSASVSSGSGQLALVDAAAANSPIIQYEEWLSETQEFIANIPTDIPMRTKLLAKVLLRHTGDEIVNIRDIKSREWERQRSVAGSHGEHVVQTGALPQCIVRIS